MIGDFFLEPEDIKEPEEGDLYMDRDTLEMWVYLADQTWQSLTASDEWKIVAP